MNESPPDLKPGMQATVTGDMGSFSHPFKSGTVVTLGRRREYGRLGWGWACIEVDGTDDEDWNVSEKDLRPLEPTDAEVQEALTSIQETYVGTLEKLTAEAEAEAAAQVRQWTLIEDEGGYLTECPWCNGADCIVEVDHATRWNSITVNTSKVAVAHIGKNADFEFQEWMCSECYETRLEAPPGFEIEDWI